jgi:hypothetical protein
MLICPSCKKQEGMLELLRIELETVRKEYKELQEKSKQQEYWLAEQLRQINELIKLRYEESKNNGQE